MSLIEHPRSRAADAALELASATYTTVMLNHCLRSFHWAASYGDAAGVSYDPELLYVSSLLHDIGLVDRFDNATLSFEYAGAAVLEAFGAGAGWMPSRRRRAGDIVVAHMAADLADAHVDPEGHLLSIATSLDISGARIDAWSFPFRAETLARYPRGSLADEFVGLLESQAHRKPESSAAGALRGGIAARARANALDDVAPATTDAEEGRHG